jgi:hypothetical protein
MRDGARAVARAIAVLDGPREELYVELERIRQLSSEGRRIRRAAVAEEMEKPADPLVAIRRKACIEHVAQGVRASAKVARAVERATVAAA